MGQSDPGGQHQGGVRPNRPQPDIPYCPLGETANTKANEPFAMRQMTAVRVSLGSNAAVRRHPGTLPQHRSKQTLRRWG
jgi:hypothetical protein